MIRLLAIVVLFLGCQAKPTRVYESTPVATAEKKLNLIDLQDTVILDAREPFDFQVSHLNGAINIRWQDFAEREYPLTGLLEKDYFFHARRLARYGIDVDTPIIVVGGGLQGKGEEGRLAWTLKFYGIKRVQFMSIDAFDRPLTQNEAPVRESVALWKPKVDSSLLVDKKEFLKKILVPRLGDKALVLIDVRSEAEYLGKVGTLVSKKAPDLAAINIPWNQFLTSQGLVDLSMAEKLQALLISKDREIFVISGKGIRSAAVTMALRELGYTKARNFAGGYLQLIH